MSSEHRGELRIVHFADVHLDRPFVGLPRHVAKRRRGDLFDAFRRCLTVARDRDADVITIGGDLWEEEHVTSDTRQSVAHELTAWGKPALVLCGNHDPLLPGGSYLRTEWSENVMIFRRGRLEERTFGSVGLWGISWGGGELPSGLMSALDAPNDGRVHVVLLHGTAGPLAALTDEAYFPFDPKRVEDAGFSLCLAGHIHVADQVERVVYPGSPEPLGWGEQGRHCAIVVDVDCGRQPSVELIDVNKSRYETRQLDCSGCGSSASIQERLRESLADDDAGNVYLRLHLIGEVGSECEVDPSRLAREHENRYGVLLIEDRTEPLLDISKRAARKGLEGIFVRKLLERLEAAEDEDDRRRIELAIHAGLRAIEGRDEILHVD